MRCRPLFFLGTIVLAFLLCSPAVQAADLQDIQQFVDAGRLPEGIVQQIGQTGEAEIIVTLNDADVRAQAAQMRRNLHLKNDNGAIISEKARLYGQKKAAVLAGIPALSYSVLRDYDKFPVMFMKVNEQALTALLNMKEVSAVSENMALVPFLAESLPLINQPEAESAGATGAGTFVAVVDSGVYYDNGYFGTCSGGPGSTGCEVAFEQCLATGGCQTDKSHGTNVSGIVLGVAPSSRVLALDVFRSSGYAYDSDIITALNWVLTEQGDAQGPYYGRIEAVNLSLGGGQYNSQCPGDALASPITNLKTAGVATAAAAGNNGYAGSLSSPACVPDAVSVGAVYDSDVGSRSWCTDSTCNTTLCTDSTTAADQVTCFSNSASFLTMLAPGSVIAAAGISMSGTSQATPFVAGSVAAIKGLYASLSVSDVVSSMTGTGPLITDPKSSITKPRLDLYNALLAAGPEIGVTPSSHDFGSVNEGSSSTPETFTVTNSGPADLVLGTLTLTGTSAADFTKQNDGCSGKTLSTSGNCSVDVTFSPQSTGSKSAGLSVPSNDPVDPTVNVPLSGSSVSSLSADFGAVPLSGTLPLYVGFTDQSTGSPSSWAWSFGDNGTSTLQDPFHNYTAAGTYTVALTVTNSGGSDTVTKTGLITVTACGNAPVELISGASTTGYQDLQTAAGSATTSGSIIRAQALDFTGDLSFGNGVALVLDGGYGCDYGANPAYSTIVGSLTVTSGEVTLNRVTIE